MRCSCPAAIPGHTQPKYLMALLEKQTAVLHKYHPKAQMWVSPQSFNAAWMDEFFGIVKTEPAWLGGIVFGPQVRISLPELRAAVPEALSDPPLPGHHAQPAVPVSRADWDVAFAVTRGARGDQSAAAGSGRDLPPAAAVHESAFSRTRKAATTT